MERRLRLRQSQDFVRIRQQGRKYSQQTIMLSILPNGSGCNRYGIVTSRRLGKAVVRNRVRRLIREVLRALHSDLRQGYDVVIVARPAIAGQPYSSVRRIIEQLLVQSGMLPPESDQT